MTKLSDRLDRLIRIATGQRKHLEEIKAENQGLKEETQKQDEEIKSDISALNDAISRLEKDK